MDDLGNEIKNGGAWTSFRQHLSPYYEKSSEGTLFSSAQQIQIMDFLMNDVDVAAMGPQVYDAISRLDMHACMHACIHTYIQTYIHTYIHTYTNIDTRIYRHTLDLAANARDKGNRR